VEVDDGAEDVDLQLDLDGRKILGDSEEDYYEYESLAF
jgi:hypothetical protein